MFCLTESLSFVQNPGLTSYQTLLDFLLLSWVFDFFSIFQKDFFFQGASRMFFVLPLYFCSFVTAFAWFICVFVLLSLTEDKGRALEITRDFLFSLSVSVFLSFFFWCALHLSQVPYLFCFLLCHLQSLPTLKGCEQRKCSSMGPSLGLMW